MIALKIVLASPNYPQPRGNTVTVQRIASNLEKLDVETEIVSTTDEESLLSFPTGDLVHGFHAYQFYHFMKKMDRPPTRYVVTLTGTDLNQDLFDPTRREDVLDSLKNAAAIHVFDEKAKAVLIDECPELKGKIFAIAQGNSDFPADQPSVTKEAGSFLFLLPAGIRKVKNIPAAISMLQKLQHKHPELRLWLVGPVLEEEEGKIVADLVREHADWIRYLGQLPHPEMSSVYEQADVVLNSSHSEGQPAAILEAMGHARPVLVSDIPGNSSIVTHEETGFLYRHEEEFLEYADRLMKDKKLLENIGQRAALHIAEFHSGAAEAKALWSVYNEVLK